MADLQISLGKNHEDDPGSRMSSIPLLGDGFQEDISQAKGNRDREAIESSDFDAKQGKRRFWNLVRKKEDDKAKKNREPAMVNTPATTRNPKGTTLAETSLPAIGNVAATGAVPSPYTSPSSPGRNLRSSSPAPPSPASSQIFERSVQEDGIVATSPSLAIPAHITTENHIPPVLDASSEAITNDHLTPDNVEIVMHAAHQPAAVTVTGSGTSEATGTTWQDDLVAHPDADDAASNYGALDSADVRRLSFISFADVIHAEHADHPTSAAPNMMTPVSSHNRSPSPLRSPLSSQISGGSPLLPELSVSTGAEVSPAKLGKSSNSPFSGPSPPERGELTIETMRQALRKTGSGDLSGARSAPLSASGGEDIVTEHPFR